MGFREPLDLSGILPSYKEFLGDHESTARVNFVTERADYRDPFDHEAVPKRLYAPTPPPISDDPRRIGNGPPTCSTGVAAASGRPTFAWDVNGYYRTIGVPFPYVGATKKDLREAFYAVRGHESARTTYCLKQLLDPVVRAEYDAMPLGEPYLNDEYIQDALKKKAAAEAGRRSGRGSYTSAESVLDEWGYVLKPEQDPTKHGEVENVTEGVDNPDFSEQDSPAPEFDPIEWTYSYWLWKSHGLGSTDRLQEWQTLLVSALAEREEKVQIAVGVVGKQPHPYVVGFVDNSTWVVFLNEKTDPSPEVAASAADALISTMQNR